MKYGNNKYEDIKRVDFSEISFTISYYHINLSKVNQKNIFILYY